MHIPSSPANVFAARDELAGELVRRAFRAARTRTTGDIPPHTANKFAG